MLLSVIATGSPATATALHHGGRILLLDAGVQAQKIMRGIDHRLEDVSGCLITHEHMDHCRAVESLTALGVECYGSHGTRRRFPDCMPPGCPFPLTRSCAAASPSATTRWTPAAG